MKNKPIIVVAGEPNSIFLEIFFKTMKKKIKHPIVLICSIKLLKMQMNYLKYKEKIRIIKYTDLKILNLNNKSINIIDIKYSQKYAFQKVSKKSKNYIKKSFDIAFKIIKLGLANKLINGPVSKTSFLDKKFLGMTEYISHNFSSTNNAMLIFNKDLSVCPLTTHMPIKLVSKSINQNLIKKKVKLIDNFYKKYLGYGPQIAVTGLNPHCESNENNNEDLTIIKPAISYLKNKGYNISGPYSADTIFLKKNRKIYDVIIGMYHDQVLGPLKTLYEYNAINITLGLPFIRISPDHGPNEEMLGKNLSSPLSLINSILFLDKN